MKWPKYPNHKPEPKTTERGSIGKIGPKSANGFRVPSLRGVVWIGFLVRPKSKSTAFVFSINECKGTSTMLSSSLLCKLKSTVHQHPTTTTTKRSCHYSFLTSIPSKSLHGRFSPVFYPAAHSSSTTFSGLISSVPQQSIDLADEIDGKINTQVEEKNPDSSSKAFKTIPKHPRRKRRKPLKISTRPVSPFSQLTYSITALVLW